MAKAKDNLGRPLDPDQLPLKVPTVIRCACPCRRVIQVEPGATGRPRKYYEENCRSAGYRARKDAAERERQRVEYEARQRRVEDEADEARETLRNRRDVAEAAWVWRLVFGHGWQKLTVQQVFAIRDAFDAMARGQDVHVLNGNPAALVEGPTRSIRGVELESSRPSRNVPEVDDDEPADLDDEDGGED